MEARWTRWLFAAAVVAVLCAGLVIVQMGLGVLVAGSTVGALVGIWAVVYARAMCACQRLKVTDLWRAAAAGALIAPGVLLVERAIGPVVWVVVALGALVWAAAISDDGHLHLLAAGHHRRHSPGQSRHV
ncbi:MAG TPA: hypothetical protein VE503_08825 [Ornithinibacter sp.]|nr:hypothetical protein [Ornithinibacter sp.]